jgi:hypothetical protein
MVFKMCKKVCLFVKHQKLSRPKRGNCKHLSENKTRERQIDDCGSSVVGHAEQRGTSTDPVILRHLTGNRHEQNEVGGVAGGTELTSSQGGLIERASINLFFNNILVNDWLEPDDWHSNNRDLGVAIFDGLLLEVPLCALEEETMHVDTI